MFTKLLSFLKTHKIMIIELSISFSVISLLYIGIYITNDKMKIDMKIELNTYPSLTYETIDCSYVSDQCILNNVSLYDFKVKKLILNTLKNKNDINFELMNIYYQDKPILNTINLDKSLNIFINAKYTEKDNNTTLLKGNVSFNIPLEFTILFNFDILSLENLNKNVLKQEHAFEKIISNIVFNSLSMKMDLKNNNFLKLITYEWYEKKIKNVDNLEEFHFELFDVKKEIIKLSQKDFNKLLEQKLLTFYNEKVSNFYLGKEQYLKIELLSSQLLWNDLKEKFQKYIHFYNHYNTKTKQ